MKLHITPSFNIDRLCKTASVLLFLVINKIIDLIKFTHFKHSTYINAVFGFGAWMYNVIMLTAVQPRYTLYATYYSKTNRKFLLLLHAHLVYLRCIFQNFPSRYIGVIKKEKKKHRWTINPCFMVIIRHLTGSVIMFM